MSNERFLAEVLEQPQALQRTVASFSEAAGELSRVADRIQRGSFDRVVLTGMGSSLFGCHSLALSLTASLPIPVTVWDASELVHQSPGALTGRTLLVAVSQSGESAEVVEVTRLSQRPGAAIAITNGPENTLAGWADVSLCTNAGAEEAVSSKTYTATLAAQALAAAALGQPDGGQIAGQILALAERLADYLTDWQSRIEPISDFLGPCETLAYLGRGHSLSTACTAALITEESSKVFCMGVSAAQFRHGPIELARPGLKVVIFAGSGPTRRLNENFSGELAGHGAQVVLITAQPQAGLDSANLLQSAIPTAPASLLPILEIVPIQLLTIPLAEARGFRPATFQHTTKVTDRE